MNPLIFIQELFSRVVERKWQVISLFFLCLCSTMCGIIFIKTPAFYDYHLRICDRFLDRICYSDQSLALIFIERTLGNILFLLLLMIGGLHPAALVLPTTALAFRAYTFGGMLAILCSVYGFSGGLVVITVYLPIHLLLDLVFLCAGAISFHRAFRFRFCMNDFKELLLDFAVLCALIAVICLFEAFLLGVLFHPLGNLL